MRRSLLSPALALAAATLSGCATKAIDEGDIEAKLSQEVARQTGGATPKVDCPGGQDARKGTTFACVTVIGGKPATLLVRVESDSGRITMKVEGP